MPQYTYERNVDGTNSSTSFTLNDKTINIGDQVELSEDEHARLSPYFVLSSGGSQSVPVEAVKDEDTSGSGDTISEEKSSPSASSKKS